MLSTHEKVFNYERKLYSWAGGQHSMRGMEGEPDLISGYYHMKDALLEHCCMVHGARGM
jgi:hypothetical protein